MAALWSWMTIRLPVASSRVAGAVTTPSTATVPSPLRRAAAIVIVFGAADPPPGSGVEPAAGGPARR